MRPILRTMVAAGAIFVVASIAQASDPIALDGEYQLGGRLDHKGSPTEGSSHLYLSISNESARALFESLPGDAREDACTGYRVKGLGNVGCYETKPGEAYFCSFSVNLERASVEAGQGGCI